MSSQSKHCVDQFGFSHDKPELFRVSQWGDPKSTWYLSYRIILAVAYTTIYITLWTLNPRPSEHGSKWLIYLTNQSMLLLVIQLVLQMVLAIHIRKKDNNLR